MTHKLRALALTAAIAACQCAAAQDGGQGVTVSGSIQSDILFPEKDDKIGTEEYSEWGLTNTYLDLTLGSKIIDAGGRFEYLEHPMPGFEDKFKGWGLANIYVKVKPTENIDITLGDFYEQFGSGFILRSYEERSLGVDNSIRGARLNMNALRGARLKLLGGVQRCYWDWRTDEWLGGADLELSLEEYMPALSSKGAAWTIGASYVVKHEDDETIVVPGTDSKLNLPGEVHSFDLRSQFQKGGFSLLAEYAWKTQDPSFDNNYIYHRGDAVMLSTSYTHKGFTALLQAKRSENMSSRTRRRQNGLAAFVNNMPAFSYQHTYSLASLYPYATQMAKGEWAFQGEFGFNFKRHTPLGGKYGTHLKLNVSHIRGLDNEQTPLYQGSTYGTDGYRTKFFRTGELYYQDINLQMEKKLSKAFKLNLMYMNQRYDKTVIEGHGGEIRSNIFIAEGKYQFSPKTTLRGELQYLTTPDDQGDWAFGLVELSVLPHLMFTVSDQWNCGETDIHYYMASVTGNYKSHRLMIGYGRTKAGYNCSGGVCRYVTASRGFQMSYNYNF